MLRKCTRIQKNSFHVSSPLIDFIHVLIFNHIMRNYIMRHAF
ncbi:hypothetical protein AO385_0561 [Moraxella catarrhalis]|uniref:Uncharacterized protein n=1 Tax=Moraxella catarrhalis TaxID=480 RepID=A0A198UPA0_MORCA|nr:hypothetical protein AO383_1909 [Moraxella catarrhalis]OAU98104.1 hypothetical protein AO384_0351 [Moraxella catarrhalis]OAV03327.1 hypothetical protein AO385_0561 [Moraxella catarrhalis]OAV04355.1 hypothetical protein AO381_0746 [Moraxella catarrhalis]OAV18051.1 hypothetical protein AO373_1288 [Moraxella catarrhalis]